MNLGIAVSSQHKGRDWEVLARETKSDGIKKSSKHIQILVEAVVCYRPDKVHCRPFLPNTDS